MWGVKRARAERRRGRESVGEGEDLARARREKASESRAVRVEVGRVLVREGGMSGWEEVVCVVQAEQAQVKW